MKTEEEIRKELAEIFISSGFESFTPQLNELIQQYIVKTYGTLPYVWNLDYWEKSYETTGIPQILKDKYSYSQNNPNAVDNYIILSEDDDESNFDSCVFIGEECLNITETMNKIIETHKDILVLNLKQISSFHSDFRILFSDKFIMTRYFVYTLENKLPDEVKDCFVYRIPKPSIHMVCRNKHGNVVETDIDIKPRTEDISLNYNDDFVPVDDKINKVIREDSSSIIILHGAPGTGKTSYIRHLIAKNQDLKFYWIDASMFNYIDSAEFNQYILGCKNAIFILEDSESLLRSRENNRNAAMQSLLSLSDGMLGDTLNLKFICTFNTDLKNIDAAIKRKGRTKVMYEFKNLKKEKVEKLFKELNVDVSFAKDMPLCDIYNFLEDNGTAKQEKIGF